MQSKINSYVGFAVKSGKVKFGVDNIITCKRAKVVLYDGALSENSVKRLQNYIEAQNIPAFITDMESVLKDRNCKALAVLDASLAKAIVGEFVNGSKNS